MAGESPTTPTAADVLTEAGDSLEQIEEGIA